MYCGISVWQFVMHTAPFSRQSSLASATCCVVSVTDSMVKCMLYNCLEWYNLYHDRQLYNTLIPPSHESPAVGLQTCTCISRLSGSVS